VSHLAIHLGCLGHADGSIRGAEACQKSFQHIVWKLLLEVEEIDELRRPPRPHEHPLDVLGRVLHEFMQQICRAQSIPGETEHDTGQQHTHNTVPRPTGNTHTSVPARGSRDRAEGKTGGVRLAHL